ncbi:hypothetical protein, partial [Paenibacillus sp. NPDC058174]|uniref:hypothetical protein n=1 Tax=Paenibacillus sp. NPDC058174 TaxID=3346366 RepID=UPI0036DC34AD
YAGLGSCLFLPFNYANCLHNLKCDISPICIFLVHAAKGSHYRLTVKFEQKHEIVHKSVERGTFKFQVADVFLPDSLHPIGIESLKDSVKLRTI